MSHVMFSLVSRQAINHSSSRDCKFARLGVECVKSKYLSIIAMAKAIYGIKTLKCLIMYELLPSKFRSSGCVCSDYVCRSSLMALFVHA